MTTETVWDQTMLEAWSANGKANFEQHLRDVDREREAQNDWHAFGLEQARANAQIVNRAAQDHVTLSTRIQANGATIDHLVNAAAAAAMAAQTTEFRGIGAQVAQEASEAATAAVNAALAQAAQSSPPAQGTTGVAQGGMQTGASVANAAILAQIAKLAEIVGVLYVKVVGEETTAEQPA